MNAPRTKREWTDADRALVRRIALFIAAIHDTATFQIERSGAQVQ